MAIAEDETNDEAPYEDWPARRRELAEFAKREWAVEIRRYLARHGCRVADLDDLEQETYRRVMGVNTHPPRDPASFRQYVFAAAKSAHIDWHRREGREVGVDGATVADAELGDPHGTPEELAVAQETLKRLQTALEGLTPRRLDVLRRHLLLGQSHAHIAAELNIAHATVKKLLVNALMDLRRAAEEGGKP